MARVRRRRLTVLPTALVVGLGTAGLAGVGSAWAAPPTESATREVGFRGRVIEAGGSRRPVSGATVLVVDAPEDVRPGKPARDVLDPESVAWLLRAETDAEGRFTLPAVPVGKVRVVVIAGGYARLEQWAEVTAVPATRATRFYLQPDASGGYRTEVTSERATTQVEPTRVLDGQRVRHYAGSGDDPLLAALNLPGVARSPAGLGLLSFRGANPNWTGYYLDGHPIPRAFHTVPVASMVSPSMVDRLELNPGNYPASYGGFGGGLVHIHSRPGDSDGVHGDAHIDLFDVGGRISAPVGPGTLHFGGRRSHVDLILDGAQAAIARATRDDSDTSGLLIPRYWDYLGRLDFPVGDGGTFTVRALGAGDRLDGGVGYTADASAFGFAASFHRFDVDYRVERPDWKVLLSPSIRLDASTLDSTFDHERHARVFSNRMQFEARLRPWLNIEIGSDQVYSSWQRTRQELLAGAFYDPADPSQFVEERRSTGERVQVGMWVAPAFSIGERGDWRVIPAMRMNLFHRGGFEVVRFDPRLDVRGRVHPKVELDGRVGLYAVPLAIVTGSGRAGLIPSLPQVGDGFADVPGYLLDFFDPRIQGEVLPGTLGIAEILQASAAVHAQLPWEVRLDVTGFWREGFGDTLSASIEQPSGETFELDVHVRRRRGMGVEVLFSRPVGEHLDGWIGYTLSWSRIEDSSTAGTDELRWLPAVFDQRHNFVALLSASLPRGFRLGLRFRVVSGNPDDPILGPLVHSGVGNEWTIFPIRGERGASYRPTFHQLDLRLDKQWVLRRTTVGAYLDVQNVYNNQYPEVYVYSGDFRERSSLIGLPIYPSIGVQVEF